MKYEEKKSRLCELHESALRGLLIVPLLKAIGYSEVYEFHSTIEKGKDILFREASKFGESFVHAVIVSTEDITGKVGEAKSASRILEQVEMVFNETYTDKYTGKVMTVDRCWIITSAKINSFAIESISGKLQKYNLNRLIRFIDGDKLIELTDTYYPQFWQRKEEYFYYPRYEKINITSNKVDAPYNNDIDDLPAAGNLKDNIYHIKKMIESIIYDIDYYVRDKFVEILKSNHPWEIISHWEDLTSDMMDINGDISLGNKVRDLSRYFEYLEEDVKEYEKRFKLTEEDRYINNKS